MIKGCEWISLLQKTNHKTFCVCACVCVCGGGGGGGGVVNTEDWFHQKHFPL